MKLQDKVIAITGAGGIICSAFAKALAEEGAKVALLDINYEAAKQYADEIGTVSMGLIPTAKIYVIAPRVSPVAAPQRTNSVFSKGLYL